MSMAKSFRELIVWQKGIALAKATYIASAKLPTAEVYGLQSQMRRAAVGISSNIAEGSKRKTTKDFLQFLHIADGSAAELETQVIIATELYPRTDFSQIRVLLDEVQRMLSVLIRRLSSSPH